MSVSSTASMDYFQLLKAAKRLDPKTCTRTLRVAVLGDCATQQFSMILRALFHRHGIGAQIFEAGFDTIETEILDSASSLYASDAEVVVILNTVNALKAKYYAYPGEKSKFAVATLDRVTGLWAALRERSSALLIQSNFVMPLERFFGNYDHHVDGSLTDAVQVINRGLTERARSQKHVAISDVDFVASHVGRGSWLDEKQWILCKSPCALDSLPRLAQNFVDIARASLGAGIKCVVLDLDDTLWGGVIGDDGLEGIRLGHLGDGEAFHAFQCYLRELNRRGILLAVCSKNEYANAIKPFREHPDMILKEAHISAFVANWVDKAQNIRGIKETLNIGYDSIVFVDDNPFERNLVRQMLPEVVVPEMPEDAADYVKTLAALNLFETASFSTVDVERVEMYKEEAKRQILKQEFGSIDEYLRSLGMEITLARFDMGSLPRIAQLIQRSNQFNLATRRYNQVQCESMMHEADAFFPFYVGLRDRFGDYGLISVVVLRHVPERLVIDEYLMSCRVLQRGVEQYVMNEIFSYARERGIGVVEGCYRPSAKNGMVRTFFARFGFEKIRQDGEGNEEWALRTERYLPQVVHMERVPPGVRPVSAT